MLPKQAPRTFLSPNVEDCSCKKHLHGSSFLALAARLLPAPHQVLRLLPLLTRVHWKPWASTGLSCRRARRAGCPGRGGGPSQGKPVAPQPLVPSASPSHFQPARVLALLLGSPKQDWSLETVRAFTRIRIILQSGKVWREGRRETTNMRRILPQPF